MAVVCILQASGRAVEGDARRVLPDLDERLAWELWSPSGKTYRVALSWCLGWQCSCPDWQHRCRGCRSAGADEPCKHLAAIQRHLAEAWRETVPCPAIA